MKKLIPFIFVTLTSLFLASCQQPKETYKLDTEYGNSVVTLFTDNGKIIKEEVVVTTDYETLGVPKEFIELSLTTLTNQLDNTKGIIYHKELTDKIAKLTITIYYENLDFNEALNLTSTYFNIKKDDNLEKRVKTLTDSGYIKQ